MTEFTSPYSLNAQRGWHTSELLLESPVVEISLLEPKVIILRGYSSHNTDILSAVYNLSTTCFGQCCCGHHQVGYNLSEKLYWYDITQKINNTNNNNCFVLHHIYIASLINCIQPDDGHKSIDRNMQLISYIELIIYLCCDWYILIQLLP